MSKDHKKAEAQALLKRFEDESERAQLFFVNKHIRIMYSN
jgi:hypothetical protein